MIIDIIFEIFIAKEEVFMDKSRVGCIIMASGIGKRFGGDKLMAELNGKPIIQHIIDETESLFYKRIVVTRNDLVKKLCDERNIEVIYHEFPDRNDAIRLGVEAFEKYSPAGCIFCPADMPLILRVTLLKMLELIDNDREIICRTIHAGNPGAPVYFGNKYFEALKILSKGKGGREIIKENNNSVRYVEVKNEYELWDIDTREDYDKVKNKIEEITFLHQ